jgi:hypothetical protein
MITFERIEKKTVGKSNNAEVGIGSNPLDYVINNQTMDDLRTRDREPNNSNFKKVQEKIQNNGKSDVSNPILSPKLKNDLQQNDNALKTINIQDEFKDILKKNSTAKQLLDMANRRSSKISNNQIPETKLTIPLKTTSEQNLSQGNLKDFRSMFTKADRQLDLLTDQLVRSLLPDQGKTFKRYHPNDRKGMEPDHFSLKLNQMHEGELNQVAEIENASKNFYEENLEYKDDHNNSHDHNIPSAVFTPGLAFTSHVEDVQLIKNNSMQNEKKYKNLLKNLSSGIKSAVRELSNNSTIGKFRLESDEYGEIIIHESRKVK